MARTFLFFLFASFHAVSWSQSERLILIEQGTNVNSGASANQNPDFEALLDANADKVVYLRYHWFFPGSDPLNEDNPEEADNRFNDYYGQSIVPRILIDGALPNEETVGFDEDEIGWPEGSPGGVSQTLIDSAQAVLSPFEISIEYSSNPDNIDVNVNVLCTEDTTGNFKLRIAIIEEEIVFDEAPGSNGENVFKNVMKKFLPNEEGAAMGSSFELGDTFNSEESWQLNNVYDPTTLAVIAFIQNDDTKEILQSAFSNQGTFAPQNSFDASLLAITGTETSNCIDEISPSIEIRNNGSETLTSLDIDYEINDTQGTIPWSGSLDFFESAQVDLGPINFNQEEANLFVVTLNNPNGEEDENTNNNSLGEPAQVAPLATLDFTLVLRSDYYPGETSWILRNSANEILEFDSLQGPEEGGGIDATAEFQYAITVEEYDCYSFTLSDSEGDGLSFTGGNPNVTPFGFQILNSDGSVVTEFLGNDLDFGFDYTIRFETELFFSTEERTSIKDYTLYPNPARGSFRVGFSLANRDQTWVDLYSLTGQLIKSTYLGGIGPGSFTEEFDISYLPSGLYLVSIRNTNSSAVQKLSLID